MGRGVPHQLFPGGPTPPLWRQPRVLSPTLLYFVIWEHSDRVPKWLPNGHVETVTRMELDLHQGQGWWIKKLFLDAAGA